MSFFKAGTRARRPEPGTKIARCPRNFRRLILSRCVHRSLNSGAITHCCGQLFPRAGTSQYNIPQLRIYPKNESPLSALCPKTETQLWEDKCVTNHSREWFTHCIVWLYSYERVQITIDPTHFTDSDVMSKHQKLFLV